MRIGILHVLLPVLLLIPVPAASVETTAERTETPSTRSTAETAASTGIPFTDVRRQTQEFMGYNQTIHLTPAQEAARREALTGLAAPCCDDETAYTCCCNCNMAQTWWGLSKYLIAEKGLEADEVRAAVDEWFRFTNPRGFTGDACYTSGGCVRPFHKNGCGGMRASRVLWD